MAIFDGPGKGRKQCPGCGVYTGAKSNTCERCSHSFNGKKPSAPAAPAPDSPAAIAIAVGAQVAEPKVKVYDGPGQGRKQCAGCDAYVGGIIKQCPRCGSAEFKKKEAHVVQTFTEPGKGRKQCPACNVYVSGFRTAICPNCSHDFKAEAEEEEAPENSTEDTKDTVIAQKGTPPRIDYGQYAPIKNPHPTLPPMRVFIPAGECPVKLKGTDIDSVADWAEAVRDDFGNRNLSLSTQGLMYFAQTLYDFRSAECIQVKEHLRQLFLS